MDQEIRENNCKDCSNSNSEEIIDVDDSKECSCSSSNSCNKNDLELNCYSCEQIHHSPERKSPHCQDDRSCTNEVWIDDCKCDNESDDKRTLMICKCCNRLVYCYLRDSNNCIILVWFIMTWSNCAIYGQQDFLK